MVEITGSSGAVTSMMYPSYIYYTTATYKWRITVESGNLIRIKTDNCILKRDSRLEIFDGYDSASETLASYETDKLPSESILSTTNIVLIEFEISTFSESKFKLLWSKVSKTSISTSTQAQNTLNCTQNSVITVGKEDLLTLNSPGWPNGYTGGLNCIWTFLPGDMGYHVAFKFRTIDLETTENCLSDFVRVGVGSDLQTFNLSTQMCSLGYASMKDRYHGTPNLRVNFQTDYMNNRTGFDSTVMLDCGGIIEGSTGEITSNMTLRPANTTFSSFVWFNDTCTWLIKVRRGRTIQLKFDKLFAVSSRIFFFSN